MRHEMLDMRPATHRYLSQIACLKCDIYPKKREGSLHSRPLLPNPISRYEM